MIHQEVCLVQQEFYWQSGEIFNYTKYRLSQVMYLNVASVKTNFNIHIHGLIIMDVMEL